MTFTLDERLESDSVLVHHLSLSQVRLINNQDYPWVVLVPTVPDISELTDLSDADYQRLNDEIKKVSHMMQVLFKPDKLNVASIGNVVSQLHVHIIARYKSDAVFPKPVWGHAFTPYTDSHLEQVCLKIKQFLSC